MNRRAVKVARPTTQPYCDRPLPQGGFQLERIDLPVRIERYPYLSVDFDTRELCITPTCRIPLENVEYYDMVEPTADDLEWERISQPKPPKVEKAPGNATKRPGRPRKVPNADAA